MPLWVLASSPLIVVTAARLANQWAKGGFQRVAAAEEVCLDTSLFVPLVARGVNTRALPALINKFLLPSIILFKC